MPGPTEREPSCVVPGGGRGRGLAVVRGRICPVSGGRRPSPRATPAPSDPVPEPRRLLPNDAVNAFLAAARDRDPMKLLAVTAQDAPTEAVPGNGALFTAIRNQTLTEKDLAGLHPGSTATRSSVT